MPGIHSFTRYNMLPWSSWKWNKCMRIHRLHRLVVESFRFKLLQNTFNESGVTSWIAISNTLTHTAHAGQFLSANKSALTFCSFIPWTGSWPLTTDIFFVSAEKKNYYVNKWINKQFNGPSIAMVVFYYGSKTGFSAAISQMSTDLNEIWQRPVVARNCEFNFTPIGAWADPGQTMREFFFVIPKMDR